MNRRAFLATLAASAFALDPERALWVPNAKTISIAAPSRAFLAIGDVLTFGDWPDRYVVVEEARSPVRIMEARLACLDKLPRMFPTSVRRVGDTVFKSRFREQMTLTPENLRRVL